MLPETKRTLDALTAAGFVQEEGEPYYTLWLHGKAAYVTAMSSGERAPESNDFAFYFSVCDGMEEFHEVRSLAGESYISIESACQTAASLVTSFLPPEAFAPILSTEEARAWIKAMHDAGKLFHFDDDPREVLWDLPGGRTITEVEAKLLEHQVDMLMAQNAFDRSFDPYAYAVELIDGSASN